MIALGREWRRGEKKRRKIGAGRSGEEERTVRYMSIDYTS